MKKAPYIKGAREVKSTRQEVNLVAKFKGGIGAVSEGFVAMNPDKVKVIKTDEISRPLSFITKGKPTADVQTVIDYLKTPSAQKLYK
jgi:ABC-type phosphate transport system substrate-binding protein